MGIKRCKFGLFAGYAHAVFGRGECMVLSRLLGHGRSSFAKRTSPYSIPYALSCPDSIRAVTA